MTIRDGTADDLEPVARIQQATGSSSHWPVADYLQYTLKVAEVEGRVAGFLAARTVAEGEHEILNLAVASEFRRRGVAEALLGAVMDGLAGEWFLEVRASNTPARALYRKRGFQEAGVRRNYYSEPPEDAVVMRISS